MSYASKIQAMQIEIGDEDAENLGVSTKTANFSFTYALPPYETLFVYFW